MTITVSTEADGYQIGKKILFVTNKNNFYGGRHNFVSNLSYHEDAITYIKLSFDKKGSYRYDDLKVICQPTDRLDDYASALKTDNIEDLTIEDNDISLSVSLDERKALVLSVPYSKGWSAVVNGEEMEIQKANTMFMALELPPGDYDIELHYTTPYIKAGLLLTVSGVVLFIGIVIVKEKRKRKTA